jgi:hypothetical protein
VKFVSHFCCSTLCSDCVAEICNKQNFMSMSSSAGARNRDLLPQTPRPEKNGEGENAHSMSVPTIRLGQKANDLQTVKPCKTCNKLKLNGKQRRACQHVHPNLNENVTNGKQISAKQTDEFLHSSTLLAAFR